MIGTAIRCTSICGLPADSSSKKELLDALNRFLVEQHNLGNNVVLIIDEAQNLRPETLEQVRMISNLETETDKLIQILLVGQPQLKRTARAMPPARDRNPPARGTAAPDTSRP